MRKDIPEKGTILFCVRENITLGNHRIVPPPDYSTCAYAIVEAEVLGPYDWRSSGAGFRCKEKKRRSLQSIILEDG